MEKLKIKEIASQMKTVEDLAALLNEIKISEFSTTKYAITSKQLKHFCNSNIVKKRYRTFQISKKSGGSREINAPCYQLGIILHLLNIVFKAIYTPGSSAMGFSEGRSIVNNALTHVGHHYVLNLDLKDFFPSIPQKRVWARLQYPPFNFSREIANVVAGLCCNFDKERNQNVLPQGAATSPILTNTICDKLDHKMRGVGKRFGVHYSRYADDMTFSGMRSSVFHDEKFMSEIKSIIAEQGFVMNDKKTRLFQDGQRQEVTGLTVNETVNVGRKYVKDLRFYLHIWEKFGYSNAYSRFYPRYKKERGYIKKGEPVMENVISGKLNFLKMVKGSNNETYKKLKERFDKLQQVIFVDTETDKGENYVFVQSYKVKDFEEQFATKITIGISPKGKVVGKCNLFGIDKTIAISSRTQKYLCKDPKNFENMTPAMQKMLLASHITLCRHKGKNFWLISENELKRSESLSVQNAQVNIDALLNTWEHEGINAAVDLMELYLSGAKATIQIFEAVIESETKKKNAASKKALLPGEIDLDLALAMQIIESRDVEDIVIESPEEILDQTELLKKAIEENPELEQYL